MDNPRDENEKINILITDDRNENLVALEAVLKSPGVNLIRAGSGKEALKAVLKYDFAVILLDVQMPDMDGFETAKHIRSIEKSKDTPIIFLTAMRKEEAEIFTGYTVGAVDYMIKPVVPTILKSKIAVFTDLYKKTAKIKYQAAALEHLNAELKLSNEELEAFSYSASHDLRAPLRSIEGFSRIILEDYADKLDDKGKEHFRRIVTNTARMSELIDSLLLLSKAGRMEMNVKRLNLSQIAVEISGSLKESASLRNVRFVIEEGVMAWGDDHLIRIVMENFLGNAFKYTSRTEEAVIEFSRIPPKKDGPIDTACFVRDNGAGFDMVHAGKLFTPFQRLHNQNEFPGSGIGLATSSRIIKRHGGTLKAEGETNKGATFHFTLPERNPEVGDTDGLRCTGNCRMGATHQNT